MTAAAVLALGFAVVAIAAIDSVHIAARSSQIAAAPSVIVSRVLDDDDWMRDVRAGRFFNPTRHSPSNYRRNYTDEVTPRRWGSRSNLGRPPPRERRNRRSRSHNPPVRLNSTTYRTVCVRLCDGAFFPISTSTTRDRFDKDEAACKSQCGAPSRLYVYKTIGGSPETMVDVDGRAYDKQPNAFLFRTKYVPNCKCRPHPWEKAARDRHASYETKAWKRKARRIARLDRRKARKQRHRVRALRRWLEKNGAAIAMGSVVSPPPRRVRVLRTAYRPRAARVRFTGGNGPVTGTSRRRVRPGLRNGRMGLGAGNRGTRRVERRRRERTYRPVVSRQGGWRGRAFDGMN
ncbi:MAG: DUF2865 domain-containing protein [Hyphomicrobiaceae bacterium]|nr:DUF2865 domain-containing protein [Hyphomicrobiaceae bacterium]